MPKGRREDFTQNGGHREVLATSHPSLWTKTTIFWLQKFFGSRLLFGDILSKISYLDFYYYIPSTVSEGDLGHCDNFFFI
jgi:hypothetical protein